MPREAEGEHRSAGTRVSPSMPAGPPDGLSALLVELVRSEPEVAGGWERVPLPGAVIGRFELLRELGRGGFGVVFEARDRELGRLVAFKAVRPGTRASAAQRTEWLRREAEATAQLSHENIVALHDAGASEHGPYLVFELLEGETVAQRLERGPLGPREAVRVAIAVARALAYAHAAGVLHRDLKPSNVFLTARGQVKVLDFGLAHVFGWTGPASAGTPAYMAPEQWRGAPEDARTDVFALGVMLHEMVTSRLPFVVEDGRSAAVDPDAPAPGLEGVPSRLRPVIASAVAPDPERRPHNAEVLLEQLVAVERTLAAPRRRGRSIAAAAAAIALLVALSALAVWRVARTPPPGAGPPQRGGAEPPARAGSSIDAYAHYFRAREAADGWRMEEAVAELERALELDPELALAYYLRAHLAEFTGVPASIRRAHVEAALRFADRLPAKEQLLVRAWGAHVRGDDLESGRIYRDAVHRFPEDPDVLYFGGDFLFHLGDLESAAELFQRAVDARPGWAPPLAHLVETFDGLGRLEAVLPALRRAMAAAPNAATYAALGEAYQALGAPDEAVRALRAAVAAGGGPLSIQQLGDALLRASRLGEVEAEARRLLAPDVPPRLQLAGHALLIRLRTFQGRNREAVRLLEAIPGPVRDSSPESARALAVGALTVSGADAERLWVEARDWGNRHMAAVHLAYSGDLAHAAELARGLGAGSDRELYEGIVAWRRGQLEAAAGRLRSATRRGANTRPLALWALAEVLAELGRHGEALEAVRAGRPFSRSTQLLLHPRSLLLEARALERLGRRDEARARADELLALWKDADPDLPALGEARALRGRLVEGAAPVRPARPRAR